MHKTRQDRDYKAKELESQRKYKQNARKNLFVLEFERVKKQEYRRNKRKIDEMHECTDLEETHNKRKKKLDYHEKTSYQSHFKDIKEIYKAISFKYSCRTIVCMYLLPSNVVSKRCLHVQEHQFANK